MGETKNTEEKIEELCQSIFGKSTKDIKYLYVTNYIHKQLMDEELARTGLYQWQNVFNGEVKYPRDVSDYSKYDIVHVNMSTQDIPLIKDIEESLTDEQRKHTKIIVNNDYTTESWGNSFLSPNSLAREIRDVDMIFGTEYYQTTALTELTGRTCYVIPHPADIRRLKSLPQIPKKELITTIWRRYDNFTYIPSLVVRNHGLTTQLIGFDKDNKTWLTTTLFDYVYAGTNTFDFSDQLRESRIVYDPFTYHSFNRSIVDCAAMGVAVVGSNRTQSINICYPFTKVDPYDVKSARILIDKLLTDKEFYDKVINYALTASESYSNMNSKLVFLESLYESLNTDKKAKDIKKLQVSEKGTGDDVLKIMSNEKTRKRNESEKRPWKNYIDYRSR